MTRNYAQTEFFLELSFNIVVNLPTEAHSLDGEYTHMGLGDDKRIESSYDNDGICFVRHTYIPWSTYIVYFLDMESLVKFRMKYL